MLIVSCRINVNQHTMVPKFASAKIKQTFAAYSNLCTFLRKFPSSQIYYLMKQNIIFSHLKIFLELKLPRKIKFVPKASKIDKAIKPLFLAHNIIKCSTCKKPKWFFSNGKLNQRDIYLCKKLKMKVFPLAKIRSFCHTTNASQPLF